MKGSSLNFLHLKETMPEAESEWDFEPRTTVGHLHKLQVEFRTLFERV
jgi:hypothetical protein